MTTTMVRADVDALESLLLLVTQPQPDQPLRYTLVRDLLDERPGVPGDCGHEEGHLESLEQLREIMLTMLPTSFIIVEPAHLGWFAQTKLQPEGWLVELGLLHPGGSDVFHYTGHDDDHFSLAAAYAMMCQLCRRQALDLPTPSEHMTFPGGP